MLVDNEQAGFVLGHDVAVVHLEQSRRGRRRRQFAHGSACATPQRPGRRIVASGGLATRGCLTSVAYGQNLIRRLRQAPFRARIGGDAGLAFDLSVDGRERSRLARRSSDARRVRLGRGGRFLTLKKSAKAAQSSPRRNPPDLRHPGPGRKDPALGRRQPLPCLPKACTRRRQVGRPEPHL